jgi:hypothetical protein
LACETPNQRCRKANKAIGFDKFVEVNAQKLHRNTEMASKVEMLRHSDDMMFLLMILRNNEVELFTKRLTHTHFRKLSKILISTKA